MTIGYICFSQWQLVISVSANDITQEKISDAQLQQNIELAQTQVQQTTNRRRRRRQTNSQPTEVFTFTDNPDAYGVVSFDQLKTLRWILLLHVYI